MQSDTCLNKWKNISGFAGEKYLCRQKLRFISRMFCLFRVCFVWGWFITRGRDFMRQGGHKQTNERKKKNPSWRSGADFDQLPGKVGLHQKLENTRVQCVSWAACGKQTKAACLPAAVRRLYLVWISAVSSWWLPQPGTTLISVRRAS